MKKFFTFIISLLIIYTAIFIFKDDIFSFYDNLLYKEEKITIKNNNYAKSNGYMYVQLTDDFYAKNKKHLLNIFYTIINSGNETFTFYCSKDYKNCKNDINSIINDEDVLLAINNFVHPFNSFKKISLSIENKKIDLTVYKLYNDEEINKINSKVDDILSNIVFNSMDVYQKIEAIHNYIVMNTKYLKTNIDYNKATTLLFENKGVCSAYTDTMTIFLSRLNLNNYKIATEEHIWNLVKINDNWLHIDVTFDDPINSNNEDILLTDMLLINTNKLLELDNESHNFDRNIYKEA